MRSDSKEDNATTIEACTPSESDICSHKHPSFPVNLQGKDKVNLSDFELLKVLGTGGELNTINLFLLLNKM